MNLVEYYGILMDNAIEAANECEEKIINVYIRNWFSCDKNISDYKST